MNFKAKIIVLFAMFLPVFLTGQVIDTISYVPVKHGNYESIVTKTSTKLAATTGASTIESLNVNSNTLNIKTGQINFGAPVFVGSFATIGAGSTLKSTGELKIGGTVSTGGTVIATRADNTTRIKARDIELPGKTLEMGATTPFVVDNVTIQAPADSGDLSCPVDPSKGQYGAKWILTDGWNADEKYAQFSILGCSGMRTKECRASDDDQKACNDSGNSWYDTGCCCKGNFITYFPKGSQARMCSDDTMCSGENLVNQYLACSGSYSSTSKECICAKGTKEECIRAIYGSGSEEYYCLSNATKMKKWPCTCPQYQNLISGTNYRNYGCLNSTNKPTGSCDLTCSFPETKEYYSGKYRCCCLDYGYKYGYPDTCDSDTPVCQNPVQRCCCLGNQYGQPRVVGRAKNYDTCAKLYYGDEGYYPDYGYGGGYCECEYGYYSVDDGWGSSYQQYVKPDLCACDGSYAY